MHSCRLKKNWQVCQEEPMASAQLQAPEELASLSKEPNFYSTAAGSRQLASLRFSLCAGLKQLIGRKVLDERPTTFQHDCDQQKFSSFR